MTEIEKLRKRVDDRLRLLTKDINKLFIEVEERGLIIDTLAREKEQLEAYCDKLADGLPEGMLPKDIEILRKANTDMAELIVQLEAEIVLLKAEAEGAGSLLLDVQQDCIKLRLELEQLRVEGARADDY